MTISHGIVMSKAQLHRKGAPGKTVLYFIDASLFQHLLLCWNSQSLVPGEVI